MHEHFTHAIYYFEVHLIYSSIVWLAAWALTSIPGASAGAKYWIWAATALNFVLPVGALIDGIMGPHITWATPIGIVGALGVVISDSAALAAALGAVWMIGATAMLARLCARVAVEHRSERAAHDRNGRPRGDLRAGGVAVRFGDARQGPAVNGILHSHISLPLGIDRLLSERELNSVLMHELTHARRHDNLIRLMYEITLCVLWFHPLMWITGARLALYRELSCDEAVIQRGHGKELISALAKLVSSDEPLLLQAGAASFLSRRIAQLAAPQPARMSMVANALLAMCFAGVFAAGVFATVAHTACCFVAKT